MKSEITGITRANEGMRAFPGISWPDLCAEKLHRALLFLARDAAGGPSCRRTSTPDQDEYLYMLEGKLDFMLAGSDQPTAGRSIGLGMGMPHGIVDVRPDRQSAGLAEEPESCTICFGVFTI